MKLLRHLFLVTVTNKRKGLHYWSEKVIILLAVIGSVFWVDRFLPTKALTKIIYPSHCFGEWFGSERVLGQPDVSEKGEATEFNSENSAFYQTGFASLICEGFPIDNKGKFVSAKLGLSLAITEIPKEPEEIEQPPEQSEKLEEPEELELPQQPEQPSEPEEQPQQPPEPVSLYRKFNDFIRRVAFKILPIFAQEPESASSPPESASQENTTSTSSQESIISGEATSTPQEIIPSPDAILNLRYLLGQKTYLLNTFSSHPISPATNNGYFYYDLPEVKSFKDLENLKISLEGLLGGKPHLNVWLDSVWVEITYYGEEKPTLKIFQEFDGNDFEIFVELEGKKIQITDNNFDDKFPSNDDKEIVWQGMVNSRWQIFYLDLNDFLIGQKEPVQITQTSYNNISPKVLDKEIVWQAWLDNNWEIMVAKKDDQENWQIERITKNQAHDLNPYFSQGEIFWQRKIENQFKKYKATKTENQWQILEIE